MKANFAQMSTKELRVYVLAHREDIEALEILFSRRTPDSEAMIYPSIFTEDGQPIEENIRIAEEAIAQRIQQNHHQDE
ncbi:hypothetical protein IQ259_00180 [Fortiea sp. LEGE XX443]|uniref:DUF6887 family protein n=1 Tax=Fortiea sp. LEGE XX443 TaxID=1828611 RepID=UPI00187F26DE|nr:hypothetical protein [Fortiea sp. LEGE XX443]MBE9003487.1 hypothetical protein [Fortiea sp. LEGE XX443]